VVEDNPKLRDVLGMLLEFERMRFDLVADGQQALDWLASQRPALVILDWRLPKVGGAQVVRAIRELYGSEVPILVLSAAVDAAEARQAGADGHLRKPYAVEDLVAAIRRLLGTGR
jgi:DNA-binding response OmpR family regulator